MANVFSEAWQLLLSLHFLAERNWYLGYLNLYSVHVVYYKK